MALLNVYRASRRLLPHAKWMGQNATMQCSSSCSERCEDYVLARKPTHDPSLEERYQQDLPQLCTEESNAYQGLNGMVQNKQPGSAPSAPFTPIGVDEVSTRRCWTAPEAPEVHDVDKQGTGMSKAAANPQDSYQHKEAEAESRMQTVNPSVASSSQIDWNGTSMNASQSPSAASLPDAPQKSEASAHGTPSQDDISADPTQSGSFGANSGETAPFMKQTSKIQTSSSTIEKSTKHKAMMRHGTSGFDKGNGNSDKTKRISTSTNSSTALPFPKRPIMSKLSKESWGKLEELFKRMDADGSNQVTYEEALMFFKGSFGKFSCDAMFNEVDVDKSGQISADEFMDFWVQVRKSGYSDQDILDEVEVVLEGGTWVDWKDQRDTTSSSKLTFPKRPLLCAVSRENWNLLRQLFDRMDSDKHMVISRDDATAYFKVGGYANVSTEAMFNEVDVEGKGVITADDWMKFWRQVRASGYSNKHIAEEIKSLLEGSAWVDWLDGRTT